MLKKVFRQYGIRIIGAVLMVLALQRLGTGMEVLAADGNGGSAMSFAYVNQDTVLYQDADESSEVIAQMPKGLLVLPLQDNGTWAYVQVQGMNGYIRSGCLQADNPDAAIIGEMEELERFNAVFADEFERLMAEKRRSRIFGAIIIVLIVGIFAVGIVTTLRKSKKGDTEKGKEKNLIQLIRDLVPKK